MILMSERRAKKCHDAVAHDSVHRTFVSMDGVDHALDGRVQQFVRVLRVSAREQLHRTRDICKHDRY
jgi:hypothetical protein